MSGDGPKSSVNINTHNQILPEDELPVFQDTARDRDPRAASPRQFDLSPDEYTFTNDPITSEATGPEPKPEEEDVLADQKILPDPDLDLPVHSVNDLPATIAMPLRTIQYSAIIDRKSLLLELNKTVPLSELGLPLYMYRVDLLNPEDFRTIPSIRKAHELQDSLTAAMVHISYVEGYPTFSSGMPIWSQLEYEDREAYEAFSFYLEMLGARTTQGMAAWPTNELREWLIINYWPVRAKAYDLFRASHHHRMRMQRVMKAENSHYDIAEDFLVKLKRRVKSLTTEDLESMDPLQLARAFDLVVKMQRVSIGLPAMGGEKMEESNKRRLISQEATFRQLADHTAREEALTIDLDDTNEREQAVVDLLRENPEALERAQSLILQLQRKDHEIQEGNQS